MTFRLGAALAAVVFAVTSGTTAMEVHQLTAHGGQAPTSPTSPTSPTTPPTPVAAAPAGHGEQVEPSHREHEGHHGQGHASATHHAHQVAAHAAQQTGADSPGGHSGHSEHGSTECTCVGPCASGAPPSLVQPTFAELHLAEPEPTQLVPVPVDAVHQDPRSYLLPFSNAPPKRV